MHAGSVGGADDFNGADSAQNPYATDFYADADKAHGVTSIVIPAGVESIDPAFFQLFPNAASVNVAEGNQHLISYNGMLFGVSDAGEPTDLLLVPEGMEGAAVLPYSLATVPACAFSRCNKLSAIVFPKGSAASTRLTARNGILYSENQNDSGEPDGTLTLLAAPPALGASASIAPECTQIAEGAFWGNESLRTIIAAGPIASIATGAASSDGTSLPAFDQQVIAEATVLTTECAAWEAAGFTHFAEPAEPGDATTLAKDESGFVYTLMEDGHLSVKWLGDAPATGARTIVEKATLNGVDYTVTTIEDGAFRGQTELTELVLPGTITSIGASAFEGCTALTDLAIPASMRTIGSRAFAGSGIAALTLPASVATIGDEVFADCSDLTTLATMGTVADVAASALTGTAGVSVYVPYREDGAYAWSIGAPAAGNHLMPYGVKAAPDTINLKLGDTEQADIFQGGYLEAPGDIEVQTSYRSCVSVTDNRTVVAKQIGTTPVIATLTLDGRTIAAATANVAVAPADKVESPVEEDAADDSDEESGLDQLVNEAEGFAEQSISDTPSSGLNGNVDFFIYETVALRPIDGGAQARAAIPTGFLDPNGGAITRMFIYDWDGIPAGTTTTLNDRFNETDGNNLGLGFHVSTIDTVYLYYYNSAGIRNLKIKYTVQPPSGYKLKDGYVYSSTDPAGKRNWQNNHTFSSGDLGAFSAALNREYFVTPIWAPINSTITLANLGDAQLPEGFSGSTRTYTESTKNLTVGAPKTNKTGHKFVGWKVSLTPQADWKQSCNIAAAYANDGKGDGKEYTQFSVAGSNGGVFGDITLTAQWKSNTNTVQFNANWPEPKNTGNTAGTYPDVTATYGSAMPKPTGYKKPSKTGYTLDGWYDAALGGTKYLNADGTNAKDWDKTTTGTKTLYAHWQANSYTVTLDLNTGSKASGTNGANLPNSTSVGYYQKFADNLGGKDVIRVPEKTHYTFAGFNSKKDGSGTAYISKKRFADPGAHEYYDILEIDDTCQSWTTAAGGTIYAKWNYSISFNANGGSGTVASKTGTYDPDDTDKTKITLPSSTAFTAPANKYFAGWNTKANGTGTSYAASAKVGNLGNTTLFAQWKTKPTVTLDPNGGAQEKASWMGTAYDGKCTVIATIDQYLPDGGMTNKAKAPTRTGYTFDGYYTKAANGAWGAKYYGSAEANGTHYLIPTATWTIANDTILYAKWTPLSSKALLDPNGGTQNPWSWSQYDNGTALYYVTATYDAPMPQSQSNMKAPVPIRTGYTFDGYYTKTADGSWGKKYYGTMTESGSKRLSSAGDWKETASVVRLYAKWTPNVYKITLDKNGATTAGTAVLYLKYEDGWYGSGTPASAANGGAGSVAGSKLSSITKPSGYAGHTFAGYAKDGSIEFIDKDGKIASGKTALFTADATVKAKWTVNKHKVKFDAGISGETTSPTATNMPAEREVAYGSSTTLPDQDSSPQRIGYTFYCWSDQADGYGTRYWPGGSYTLNVDEDVTLYAVWNRGTASYTVEYYYQNKDGSWPTPGYPNLRSTGIGSTDLSHTISGSSLVPKDHSDASSIPELDAGERHLLNNDKYGMKNVLTATIAANGTTVFEVYFKLQFQVTYGNSKPEAGTVSSAMNGWRDYSDTLGAGPQATPNDGYYFEEWSPGSSITPGYAASNLITGAFSYLAKWGMYTYTATLGAEGGTISDPDWTYQAWPVWSREFNVESPTFHLPVPERLAYTFKGWKEWKDGAIIGGPELDVAVYTGTVGDKEWRAEWERNRYTIAFDANQPEGASTRVTGEMAPQEVECYSTPNLATNAYVLDGYTFGGWKGTDRFGNEVEYADGQQIEANSLCVDADATVTLYAIWVPNTYKLTFLENKGSHPGDHVGDMPDPAEMDVVFDRKDAYRIPDAEPTRVGYEFGGWALAEGSTEVFAQPGDTYTHEVGEHMPVAGDLALYAIWLPAEGGNGYRFHFYKFTDKEHDKSLCEFTSAFTGPVDFEIAGEPAPIELPGDRTLRTDKNRVDVPGYFLYGWTWVSDWSGIPEGERARYILPTDTDMREIVIDKLGITDPELRDIELFAVWQVAYHFDVPSDAAVASLVLDASEKETWRASDVALASTTPCPITVEAWSEARPITSEVFPATDLAQIDFLYDIGQGRDNPQLALDGSARRTQQIGTVPAGAAGAAARLSGQLSVTFRDKAQVNISQKVTPGSDGTVMNGTVWDEPIARIHWLLSMDPAGALTHTLLTAPPAQGALPGDGSIEVQATPSERADGPGA